MAYSLVQAHLPTLVSAGVQFSMVKLGLKGATDYESLNNELAKDGALDDVEDSAKERDTTALIAPTSRSASSATKGASKKKRTTPDKTVKKAKPKPQTKSRRDDALE